MLLQKFFGSIDFIKQYNSVINNIKHSQFDELVKEHHIGLLLSLDSTTYIKQATKVRSFLEYYNNIEVTEEKLADVIDITTHYDAIRMFIEYDLLYIHDKEDKKVFLFDVIGYSTDYNNAVVDFLFKANLKSKTHAISLLNFMNKYNDNLYNNEELFNNVVCDSTSIVYKHYERLFKEFTYKSLSNKPENSEALQLVLDRWAICSEGIKFIFEKNKKYFRFTDKDRNYALYFILDLKEGIRIYLANAIEPEKSLSIKFDEEETIELANCNSYSRFFDLTKSTTIEF